MSYSRFSINHILFSFSLLLICSAASATPEPPSIPGSGHLLIDHYSGRILAESNADQRLEPASLTKIMSAYVVFRELAEGSVRLEDQVRVSEKAWRTGGSRMFIEVGKKVSIEELLHGMIIQSGNDASVALAEHIAGSEDSFADLMNTHAQRLGMHNSHFVNSTGLPHKDHYTTARDISLVTAASIREFPELYAWYAIKEYTYGGIKQSNRNQLLFRDDSVDGVKTGYTEAAGYCLVTSAKRGDMRLTSVVMGTDSTESRSSASQSLLNYGFRFFESHRLYDKHHTLSQVRVWMGAQSELPVGPAQDVYVTIARRQYDKLSPRMELDPKITAPIAKGRQVGRILIDLEGTTVAEVPLIALKDIPEGGIFDKLKDRALLWFQ